MRVHTKESFTEFRHDFFSELSEKNNIIITAHIAPDDDSIASVVSMHTILTKRYPEKDIRILYTGERPERFSSFVGFEHIEFCDDVGLHLEGVEALIVLDVGSLSRVTKYPEKCKDVPVTIAIDHHKSPPDEFTLACIDTTYTSNAQHIYELFLPELKEIDHALAELFLLGILGDTGGLSHISYKDSDVFLIVKRLVEIAKVNIDMFMARTKTIPKRIVPLLQEIVKNTTFLEVEGWPPLQYSYLSSAFVRDSGYSDDEASSIAHIYLSMYVRKIEGYNWGFVISPRKDGSCRMSSRSMPGSVIVSRFHEELGVGGGHERAAGAYIAASDPEVWLQKVLEWMRHNAPHIG